MCSDHFAPSIPKLLMTDEVRDCPAEEKKITPSAATYWCCRLNTSISAWHQKLSRNNATYCYQSQPQGFKVLILVGSVASAAWMVLFQYGQKSYWEKNQMIAILNNPMHLVIQIGGLIFNANFNLHPLLLLHWKR